MNTGSGEPRQSRGLLQRSRGFCASGSPSKERGLFTAKQGKLDPGRGRSFDSGSTSPHEDGTPPSGLLRGAKDLDTAGSGISDLYHVCFESSGSIHGGAALCMGTQYGVDLSFDNLLIHHPGFTSALGLRSRQQPYPPFSLSQVSVRSPRDFAEPLPSLLMLQATACSSLCLPAPFP